MTYAVKAELKAKAKMPSTSSHSADDQLFSLDVNFSSVGNSSLVAHASEASRQ
jgi:hypothetical protein